VHALAVALAHEADPAESTRRGFLARLQPRLEAWHRYLAERRDLGGHGLSAVVHPWEAGLDNSPAWDTALHRVVPAEACSFRRADLDHSAAADRPTDLDYARYVRLARDYRNAGYDDTKAEFAFAVEDPGFNALLIAAEHALAGIAEQTGADPNPARVRAAALTRALSTRLWNPDLGMFSARDLYDDTLVPVRGVTGLLPLIVPGLPADLVNALLETASSEHFRLGEVHLVPSYDLTGPEFDSRRYWRGPSWFNTAWLLHRGLRAAGADGAADRLRQGILRDAAATGFAEYVDPHTGAGRGVRDFSWTASLALDLLATGLREER
jgi:hypothetical protein